MKAVRYIITKADKELAFSQVETMKIESALAQETIIFFCFLFNFK